MDDPLFVTEKFCRDRKEDWPQSRMSEIMAVFDFIVASFEIVRGGKFAF